MGRITLARLRPRIWALCMLMALLLVSCPSGGSGGY
jgi:hypothetical protein